jgi:RecJ-like exonuclease
MRNEYYLSVLLGIVGLSAMAWASTHVEPTSAEVTDIRPSWTGRVVQVDGNATDFGSSSGTVFFQLRDSTGSIDVVQFKSDLENIEGGVAVEGRVAVYKGEMQIIAEEVVQR